MEDSKLYSAQDVEKLKQKIAAHRDTLTKLKTEDSVDDYLLMKNEFNIFKTQVSHLERILKVLKGKQNMQLEEYKQQVTNISTQIDSLNQTVEELNSDLSLVTNKLNSDDSKVLLEDLNSSIDFQGFSNSPTKDEVSELSLAKEETVKNEDLTSIPSTHKSNMPSTFKLLQRLSKEPISIQKERTSLSTTEDITIQTISQEEPQHFPKRNFPSNSKIPSQTFNGNHKSVNMKSTISLNHFENKHTVSISANKKKSNPFILTHSVPEKNDIVTEYLDPEHTLAQEEKEDIIASSNETIQPESNPSALTHSVPEKNDTVTEYLDTEHTLAQEEKEDIIASSNETIQPESNPSTLTHSLPEKNDTVTEYFDTEHTLAQDGKEDIIASSNETIQSESNLSTQTHSVPEKNDTVTEFFDTEHTLAQDGKEDIIASSNETIQSESNPSTQTHSVPEKNDTVTEFFDTEHTLAQDGKEDIIASSNETIQSESTNKESLSFWKFFRWKS